MNFIKKTFISIFIILISLSLAITLTVYSANKGHLNEPLKKIIEFYLSKNDIKAMLPTYRITKVKKNMILYTADFF